MAWLWELWGVNDSLVYGLYGQMFFSLGVALLVQSMKQPRLHLARQLRWLAGFGLSHGLVEWGYIYIPYHAAYLSAAAVSFLRWFQLGLMVFSFLLLFQFGLRTCTRSGLFRSGQGAWYLGGGLTVLAAIVGYLAGADAAGGRMGIEVLSRYLLALPGAAMGAVGIHRGAREVRAMQAGHIARWLELSAASLAAYALLQLFTPEGRWLFIPWVAYSDLLNWTGIPIQIWRSLVAAGILAGMLKSLPVFEMETEAARAGWINRIITAQEEERRRIAHELHDTAIQGLVLLCRSLDRAEEALADGHPRAAAILTPAREQAEGLIAMLRNFTRDLRPPALESLGLVAGLRRLLTDLGERAALRWELQVSGTPYRLSEETELGIFRMAEEALRNVERHARATAVRLFLHFAPDSLTLQVLDDGCGMTRGGGASGRLESGGLGILGMQERAGLLGGELRIESGPGHGTTISVTVPSRLPGRAPRSTAQPVTGRIQEGGSRP